VEGGSSYGRLLWAVKSAYGAAPDPRQWPHALGEIAHSFGDIGASLIWRRGDGSFAVIVSDGLAQAHDAYMREGWTSLIAQRAVRHARFLNGEPFADHHLCSEEEMRAHLSSMSSRKPA
jgi:hypothetical protein